MSFRLRLEKNYNYQHLWGSVQICALLSIIKFFDVISSLETLPPQNTHCAELAVGALYLALANYQELKRHPWKKLYTGK